MKMWGDAYQPLMTRLVQESLIKLCSENLPSQGTAMDIDAIVCISSGKGAGNQIVIKIHKVLEPLKNAWQDSSDRSKSPWQIPLEKVRASQSARINANNEFPDEGPVDLTRDHSRSILQYTSENISRNLSSNKHGANSNNDQPLRLTNGSQDSSFETIDQSGAIYKGPIPVPRVDDNNPKAWKSEVLNRLTKLQPPNYKPLPHLKLKSPVKSNNVGEISDNNKGSSISPDNNTKQQSVDNLPGDDRNSREMQCKICSQVCYGGFQALQTHTQVMHRRYVCRFCYNTFSLRCNLKRHERLHVGLKPYNCKVCSKSFARSTDLKLHMHKHGMSGNDVVVPCPKCPRSFLSVQNLRWHLYKVHKETEATYACTICEKLFLDKEEYMKHRDEHTGNLGNSGSRPPSSAATNDSQENSDFIEFGPDDSLDGDSDDGNLCIDTQSEEGTMDSLCREEIENGLPVNHERPTSNNSNSTDLGFELVNEPVSVNFSTSSNNYDSNDKAVENVEPMHTSTPNIAPDGGNIKTGSRKRKKGNPTKHVEIPQAVVEDEMDIDNMYYNSPVAKQKQVDKEREVMAESYEVVSNEPEDLVMRIKPISSSATSTPVALPTATSQSMASSTMHHIAEAVMGNIVHPQPAIPTNRNYGNKGVPAQGYIPPSHSLGNSWDSSNFKNLKVALTGPSPVQFPGHKTPEPPKAPESFSPLTLPILITPDSHKYKPSPKTAIKSTPGENSPDVNTAAAEDPNKEFQCVEFGCNETYLGFSAYEDHCMIRHGRYPCKYCKQTFSGKNNRTRHMRCHVGAKVYTCPDCFKNFSRPDSMREHQFIHTLSYQEDKCRNCGSAFDKKNLLLAHLKQCYRHKMETGKSTKLIDETPAYLNNVVDTSANNENELDFKPLKPIKLESLPMLGNMDEARGTPPLSKVVNSKLAKTGSPMQRGSPTMYSGSKGLNNIPRVGNSPMSPIVIMPTDITETPPPRMSPLTISAAISAAASLSNTSMSVPVVLTANAVQAAVKAVSASTNTLVPVPIPGLIAPIPTTDRLSATSSPALVDKTQQQLNASSSGNNTESSVNSVLDAVKNLVKSRASPAIMDQNANKTPGVESTE